MSDIDAIRERHAQAVGQSTNAPKGYCDWCNSRTWPCDTRVVLDALDEVVSALLTQGGIVVGERNVARADADRLAEALRVYVDRHTILSLPASPKWEYLDRAVAALRQHDGEHVTVGLVGDQAKHDDAGRP